VSAIFSFIGTTTFCHKFIFCVCCIAAVIAHVGVVGLIVTITHVTIVVHVVPVNTIHVRFTDHVFDHVDGGRITVVPVPKPNDHAHHPPGFTTVLTVIFLTAVLLYPSVLVYE
jgi:hypothetical protein